MTGDETNPSEEEIPATDVNPHRSDGADESLHDAPPDPEDLAALQGWEPEPHPGTLVAILPNKWVRRLVLGAIPTLVFFFGSGLILASQLSVTHALQVFGTQAGRGPTSARALQAGRVETLLVSGQDNALRVAVWNRRKSLHERHFRAELSLVGGPAGVHRALARGFSGPGPVLEAIFPLPDLEPGRYHLRVRAQLGDEPFAASLPARLVKRPHARQPVPIEELKPGELPLPPGPDPDRVTVELLPGSGRTVTTELVERLTLRATLPDGGPARLEGELRLAEGKLDDAWKGQRVGRPFRTDELGLFSRHMVSRHPRLAFVLKYRLVPPTRTSDAEARWRERTFRLERRNAQAMIKPESLLVPPGAELGITVLTLARSGYAYVDCYADGLRYHAASLQISDHHGRLRLPAPKRPGLFRIQVTDDFSNPGTGTAVRTLFAVRSAGDATSIRAPDSSAVEEQRTGTRATPNGKTGLGSDGTLGLLARAVLAELPPEAFRTRRHIEALLRDRLLETSDADRRQTAAYLLTRLDHLHHPTDWLCDTTTASARALAARKRALQRVLMLGLALTFLLLLALVGPLVFANFTLSRRGSAEREELMAEFEATAGQAELEAGLRAKHDAEGNELITDLRQVRVERQRMERLRHWVQIALVAGIILLAIWATLILLLRLSWGFS